MHAPRAAQRHAAWLIRWGTVLAGGALASGALLAGGATASTAGSLAPSSTSSSDTLVLNPPTAPIATLQQQFSVSGTVAVADVPTDLEVLIGNTVIGSAEVGAADSAGVASYSGTFMLAAQGQADAVACGANTVSIESPLEGPPPVLASATLTATCTAPTATIAANPATITRASEPAQVTVNGRWFHAEQPVTLTIDGHNAGTATPDSDGFFTTPITVSGVGCGAYQVQANQPSTFTAGAALTASAPLSVTGCTAALKLDPAVLQPGQLTHVTGTGFAVGQLVTLTWRLPGGGAPPGSPLSVMPNGGGVIGTWDLVLPDSPLGPRQLVATQAGTSVTAPALIDGGPMQPSGGDRLLYRGS